jgi:hypothetical protein
VVVCCCFFVNDPLKEASRKGADANCGGNSNSIHMKARASPRLEIHVDINTLVRDFFLGFFLHPATGWFSA